MQTIGLIWFSCIIYLNDPIIIAQNQWLLPLIGDIHTNPVPIQSIVGCGASVAVAPISNSLTNLVNRYLASTNDPLLSQCVANFSLPNSGVVGGPASWNDASNACMSVFSHTNAGARSSLESMILIVAISVCCLCFESSVTNLQSSLSMRRTSSPCRR